MPTAPKTLEEMQLILLLMAENGSRSRCSREAGKHIYGHQANGRKPEHTRAAPTLRIRIKVSRP